MESTILIGIIIVCLVFIGICLIKRRPDLLVDFVVRAFGYSRNLCPRPIVETRLCVNVGISHNGFVNGLWKHLALSLYDWQFIILISSLCACGQRELYSALPKIKGNLCFLLTYKNIQGNIMIILYI